ncbi:UDP-2,4-diacetamido-2,4,6-trideoxy-beta-L-altropyranose hydrolase [Flocculibacter collagenilyticus]|uniref:UDP-2,4-diacetamido-2,4, 6-trideoxy-beta-L-altropyranose hydrolase n=1 Tax=Flocculibacter collagenilyticus TaxID=2744479 RepID=UPI0018F6ACBE|nr:UDP-2,4-diacetamido-2,4,6-trideoxy-beta-L-altropyranose hydrolase [Flocculibacter collagenilyticus]
MINSQHAIFRFDASSALGAGHFYRCLSLAQSLKQHGFQCACISYELPPQLAELWEANGFNLHPLSSNEYNRAAKFKQINDGLITANQLEVIQSQDAKIIPLLIVDHYHLHSDWYRPIKPLVKHILTIDDLANRSHHCDSLLDQSVSRNKSDYSKLTPAHCQFMLGTQYSLLNQQFNAFKTHKVDTSKPISNVMLSFGAMDSHNLSGVTLDALDDIAATHNIRVSIVLSSASPTVSAIQRQLLQTKCKSALFLDVTNIAALMAKQDLIIGACGMSTWERAALGIPTVCIIDADNQQDNGHILAEKEAAIVLGVWDEITPKKITDTVNDLIARPDIRLKLHNNSKQLCDGNGCQRASALLSKAVSKKALPSPHLLKLRKISQNDCDTLYQWQCDPSTRLFSRNTEIPSKESHIAWFHASLHNPLRAIYILSDELNQALGMVRVDFEQANLDKAEVSIAISPANKGKGLGKSALLLLRERYLTTTLLAYIDSRNTASLKIFASTGYQTCEKKDWYISPPPIYLTSKSHNSVI